MYQRTRNMASPAGCASENLFVFGNKRWCHFLLTCFLHLCLVVYQDWLKKAVTLFKVSTCAEMHILQFTCWLMWHPMHPHDESQLLQTTLRTEQTFICTATYTKLFSILPQMDMLVLWYNHWRWYGVFCPAAKHHSPSVQCVFNCCSHFISDKPITIQGLHLK